MAASADSFLPPACKQCPWELQLAAFGRVDSQPETTLGDALIAALEAGASEGGDRRCPKEQTALTAFIAVARPDDTAEVPHLWLATQPQSVGGQAPFSR